MSPKKRKDLHDCDRISSLPDDLLCRILSRLPTKHSVGTAVLSTRWKNIYASVPVLDFNDYLRRSVFTDIVSFCQFVNKVFTAVLAKSTNIRKFHLNCQRGTFDASLISFYISLASVHSLEDLFVHAESVTGLVPLPFQLFHCRTLREMNLSGAFSLSVPNYVFFPNLKTLHLHNVVLTDDKSVMRFFSGCIVLEDLILNTCVTDTISVLEVSIASLKELELYEMDGDYAFLLDAPCLESYYCRSYARRGYFGHKLTSLITADIDIVLEHDHFGDENVSQLVHMVSYASSLCLCRDSLEPLIHQLTTFPNLTKLLVESNSARGWFALPNLLNNAPCLELLHFDSGLHDANFNIFDASSCLPKRVPECMSDSLKKVRVDYFRGTEDEFKLVEYFLKNAKVLEKLIVTPDLDYHPISGIKQNFLITKRLLELPRSSMACQVLLNDRDEDL